MPAASRASLFYTILVLLLTGCSNGTGSVDERETAPPAQGAQSTFTVGGEVSGLSGSGLVLQNNGGNDLTITGNGPFTFSIQLAEGATYNATVRTQPAGQTCTVSSGTGSIANANVTNIVVNCAAAGQGQFSVGGAVSGLSGSGLVIQLNGSSDLAIASNGNFTFPALLASGAQYAVTVRTQPSNPAQQCTVANGSGTIGANVTNVRITCASETFSVGGRVSGLLGSGLVLVNNGGDAIAIDSDGPFTFPTALANGSSYAVTVRTQPSNPSQACTVRNGSAAIASSNVTNVEIICTTSEVTIGGTVSGLAGRDLVLRNNGTDDLTINSNGSFTFGTPLPIGARYSVTVAQQPTNPTQTCSVSNGTGTVGMSDVTSISIRCASPIATGFSIGGRVRDLEGSGLVLQNNGGDDLAIASNGRFEFPTRLPTLAAYNVTVRTQPSNPDQTCRVERGTGIITNDDIRNVEVRCKDEDDD